MDGEQLPDATPDCGCDATTEKRRAALARGRAARRAKRHGEDAFKGVVRNLACLCRDQFGRVYPCPYEPSRPVSSSPESPT